MRWERMYNLKEVQISVLVIVYLLQTKEGRKYQGNRLYVFFLLCSSVRAHNGKQIISHAIKQILAIAIWFSLTL